MVISVHLPKTAGSTFRDTLALVYGDAMFYDYGDQFGFVDVRPPTPAMQAIRWRRRLRYRPYIKASDKCIHGHFLASKYLDKYPDAKLITWMRDPVERVVSHYHYWKRKPDPAHSICRHLVDNKLSLLEFAQLAQMRNLQARYLDNVPLSRFSFVGLQAHFDAMIETLWPLLGVPAVPVQTKNTNASKSVGANYELDASVRAQIAELNSADVALYSEAVERAQASGRIAAPAV